MNHRLNLRRCLRPFATVSWAGCAALTGVLCVLSGAPCLAQASPPTSRPASPPSTEAPAGRPTRSDLSTQKDPNSAVPPSPAGDAAQVDPGDLPPPVELDPPVCDFGFVNPSATPTKKVKIKNKSDKPLLILASQPSCKCTTTNDISGEEIPAGGEIELEASMKAQSSPGAKKAEIKILFDGYARVVNVQLLMEVALPVRVVPGHINAVEGQPQAGRLVLETLDKQPFRITGFHGRAPKFVGWNPDTDAPRNQYLVEYNIADFKAGEKPLFLVVETDRADCPLVDVRLRHAETFPKPVLKMQDYRHTVGRIEQGGSAELFFEISDLPENEPVVSVASTTPGAKMEILETTKEGIMTKVKVRYTAPKDFTGILYSPITIYTSRRQQGMFVWGLCVPPGFSGTLGSKMVPGVGPSMKYTGDTPAAAVAPVAPSAPATPASGTATRENATKSN
jgi:hypothetical protein